MSAAHGQQIKKGDLSGKPEGVLVTVNEISTGLKVVFITQDDLNPGWVPEKRKSCEMTFTDASQITGCQLIETPKSKSLVYKHKDFSTASTQSFQYDFDLSTCKGSHQIIINYAVTCERGDGKKGSMIIPFQVKEAEVAVQTPDQNNPNEKKEDSLASQGDNGQRAETPNPPADHQDNPSSQIQTDEQNPIELEPEQITHHPPADTEKQSTFPDPPHEEAESGTSTEEKIVEPKVKKSFVPYYILFLLLVLGAVAWFIWSKKKKTLPSSHSSSPHTKTQTKTKTKTPPPSSHSPTHSHSSSSLFKATPRPHQEGNYTVVNLHQSWEDSSVRQVYLSKLMMEELNQFITEQNLKPFQEEGADAVPEIGGFILGQYKKSSQAGEWDVFLEKFTAITPGKSGVYRVSFETMAWAELAEVQDKHPSLQTVAWFHTHPGHGLFLSLPDLRIHNGFFREKFQLAMEIDSLSEGLDTAFFSRKKTGEVNNRKDRISNSWFKWEQLMKLQEKDG